MKKRIAILGSTGSIGTNALDVIESFKDSFEVTALSADSNIELLAKQAHSFRPRIVCIGSRSLLHDTKMLVPSGVKIVSGSAGLEEIVSRSDVDMVVLAISGTSCLLPLVRSIENRKKIALANKEALVSAGPLVKGLAQKNGVEIIPVDSEHSAIFQCLEGRRRFLSKVYLTGSGGPLLNVSKSRFDSLSKEEILKHPKWSMGRKITVDSATMMNKGLEIIEAQYLFDISQKDIEVLIHPEAIVHSMVEFIDGSCLAQLSIPDMRIPIQYALTYPERRRGFLKSVDFSKTAKLSFMEPDPDKFPCLDIAREAARKGRTYPAVLCASDEEAVKNYLSGGIKFSDIAKVIGKVMKRHKSSSEKRMSLDDVLNAGMWAKEEVRSICYR